MEEMMIDEYRRCSEICSRSDYSDKKSVEKSNRAVSRMYEIVQESALKGPEAVGLFTVLLDEPASARWLAHQLVETVELPRKVEDKCFEIIECLAKDDTADAIGEKIWLVEWKKKKERV